MLFGILITLAILWAILSLVGYQFLKKMFKKYKDTPRIPTPEEYNAFLRMDFGKWD